MIWNTQKNAPNYDSFLPHPKFLWTAKESGACTLPISILCWGLEHIFVCWLNDGCSKVLEVIEIDFFSWDVIISSWCKNFSFQKAGWETGVWGLRFSRKRLNQGWKVCEGADTLLPLHLIDAAGPRLLRWRTSLLALLGALVVVIVSGVQFLNLRNTTERVRVLHRCFFLFN